MWDTLIFIALMVWCLACTLVTMLRLPGTWLIVLAAVAYGWWSGWEAIGLWTLAGLVMAALVGEVLEFAVSVMTARRAGATKQAAWGALLGGILGAIFLSFLVPIPLLGTVVGALAGCFLGAVIAELSVHQQLGQGTRVGVFSAIGFGLGMIVKVALAVAMSGVVLTGAWTYKAVANAEPEGVVPDGNTMQTEVDSSAITSDDERPNPDIAPAKEGP